MFAFHNSIQDGFMIVVEFQFAWEFKPKYFFVIFNVYYKHFLRFIRFQF